MNERELAHSIVREALKRGRLVRPSTCAECGREAKLDGHHADYSKPLDVTWLCRKCHLKRHSPDRPKGFLGHRGPPLPPDAGPRLAKLKRMRQAFLEADQRYRDQLRLVIDSPAGTAEISRAIAAPMSYVSKLRRWGVPAHGPQGR